MKWAHTTHTGSIAFGSLIHTILNFTVVWMLEYAESMRESWNPCNRCIGICLHLCTKCIEELVEYLNKVSYAYMAITGNNYCSSAYNGFLLNIKHLSKNYITVKLTG